MPQFFFCEITTLDFSYAVSVKSTVEISQNFAAFSEYMNFNFTNEFLPKNVKKGCDFKLGQFLKLKNP